MGPTIKLATTILFLIFMTSFFYTTYRYERYRSLLPKPRSRGLLVAIRASFQIMHDPHDLDVSDECKAQLKHLKIGFIMIAIMMFLIGVVIVLVRSLGIEIS